MGVELTVKQKGRPKVTKPPLKTAKKSLLGPKSNGKRKSERSIAYEIVDKNFGTLQVRKTANAWWKESGKVRSLIDACKMDCNVLEACFYAGISEEQYYYFCEVHPEFYGIKSLLNSYPCFKARSTVVKNLSDPKLALSYLERKNKQEFSPRQEHTGAGGKDLIPNRYSQMTDEELQAEYQKRCLTD